MESGKIYDMMFQLNAQLGSSFNSTFKSGQSAIASMQKEIEALSKTQSDISAFQKQQSAVEATGKKLEVLQQQYDNVQKEISETEGFSSALENQLLSKQHQIDKTSISLEGQTEKLNRMSAALNEAGVDTSNLTQESAQLGEKIEEVKQKQEEAADEANSFGSVASAAFTAVGQAIVAAGIAKALKEIYDWCSECIDASIEFESVMAGVRRTVGGTDEELAAIAAEFKAMSLEIPITTSELGKIAETAGQLGVAQDAVTEFTEVMAMLATTTDLTAENAATMLAQFANITGTKDYQRLGSAVAELGDATATTASKVVDMSQGMAAAANIAGFSETDILAVAAAVGSLGIEAQAGSTAMSTLIQTLYKAVETGSDSLTDFADVAGMTADEFTAAWGDSAVSAMDAFIQGLNDTERNGRSAVVILDELGITNVRQTKAILGLANAGDLLSGTIEQANQAWEENTALQGKADIMYGTTESKLIMMQNAYGNLQVAVGDAFTPTLQKLYEIATKVSTALTGFIERNPALVRGITVFVGVLGTAVVAITAVAAAMKIAAAVASVFGLATATALGPIIAVVAGVAALAGVIVAVASAARDDAIPSVKELTTAAREMSDTIKEANAVYESTASSTLAAAGIAETYIGKLEDLEAAGITTDEQAKEYHNTLALLCQVVPELAGYIDLEKDTIDGGTAALRANTEAWKENAMQQALQSQLTTLYEKYADVLIEAEKNSIGLTKAQNNLTSAEAAYAVVQSRRAELWEEALAATGGMTGATRWLSQEYYDLERQLSDLDQEMLDAKKAQKNYTKAIEEGEDPIEAAEKAIAELEEAIKSLMGVSDESSDKGLGVVTKMDEIMSNAKTQLDGLAASYDELSVAAYGSIQSQYSLWDKAADVIATDIDEINGNVKGQEDYWRAYGDNLQLVADKAGDIEGLSEVLSGLDGSAQSVNLVAGLADAINSNDVDKINDLVTGYQDLIRAQKEAADKLGLLQSGIAEQLPEIQAQVEDAVKGMDFSAEAAISAENTIQKFIDTAVDMTPLVSAAYGKVAQAAIDALPTVSSVPVASFAPALSLPGFAVGTMSAPPGYAIVGENGPELVNFSGGEIVHTASETQRLLSAYQGADLYSAISSQDVVSADPSGASNTQIVISFAPVYQIEGVGSTSELSSILGQRDDDMKEYILEVMDEAGIDTSRRSYR